MGESCGLQAQPACVLAYPGDDPFGPGERLFIAETQYRPAEAFQLGLPKMVPQHDVIPFVNATVDFEDQPQPIAGEIGEVSTDRVLAAEPVSIDLCAAKPLPQTALRQTGSLPLITRESCSAPSHDTLIESFDRHFSLPLPLGEGLSAQERSDWPRERVWAGRRHSAKPRQCSERRLAPREPADPHPALRATFSQWEKEQNLKPAAAGAR